MSVISTVEKVNSETWKYTTSGNGPFDWYYLGKRVGTTEETFFLFSYSASQAPVLEVVDLSLEDITSLRWNTSASKGVLVWRGRRGFSEYVIYKKEGAVLTELVSVLGGEGRYYTQEVDLVGDGSLEFFVVECLNAGGESIASIEVCALSIAEPLPPDVSFTASEGNLEIVSNG